MTRVNMTELRKQLPHYLDLVAAGEAVEVTRLGRVVARMTAAVDHQEEAREFLRKLRDSAIVGDVETPIDTAWEAAI